MRRVIFTSLVMCALSVSVAQAQAVISGQLKKWHKVTLTFDSGISTSETNAVNPFTDYRLNVTFSNGSKTYLVPGYYAADGNAGNTSATAGSKWRVHFSPDTEGNWSYQVSFRTGTNVAVNTSPAAGTAVAPLDGLSGNFIIQPTDKTGNDHRAKGRLQYVGERYLRFAETGEYYLKAGCNSPENFLAYYEFDGTFDRGNDGPATADGLHHFPGHSGDWNTGDPTWKNGKGKAIIGALNYLAEEEVNALYFITMNITGDGNDTWPYISPDDTDRTRFDVSKLDQWEVVFSHADSLGIMLHFVTQERENQMLLDNGAVGNVRKMYYRELIARFSHHLAITWNMGEENGWDYQNRGTQTTQQRKDMATFFKTNDPYKSFTVIHTYTADIATIYQPLLGYPDYDGTSIQMDVNNVHDYTLNWITGSAASGKKWVVNHDETVGGVDANGSGSNQGIMRELALWPQYMAGGGGVEWYFGNDDLSEESFRSRSGMWDYTRIAKHFFHTYLPFWKMKNNDALTADASDYVFELPGRVYVIYNRFGNSGTYINLPCGTYTVKWYDPTNAGYTLQNGSVTTIQGGGSVSVGNRPYSNNDWVMLITNNFSADFSVINTGCGTQGGQITVTATGGAAPYSYLWSTGEISQTISDLNVGTYRVTVTDNNGCQLVDSAKVAQSSMVSMNLRVFLEGPYDASVGMMRDDLRAAGLIPLSEPFTALGFTHVYPGGGETTTAAVFSVGGPDAIVDWIMVELRNKSNRAQVLATRSGLLQRDGDIVDVNGYLPLVFPGTACDDYYIAIRHRNHLGFMTQNAEPFTSTVGLDLTNTSVQLYGSNAQKTISAKHAMWSGNCNNDKLLKYTGSSNDKDLILTRAGGASAPVSVAAGYYREDVNLDGYVKYMGLNNDRDIILLNVGGVTPAGTRTEQLP